MTDRIARAMPDTRTRYAGLPQPGTRVRLLGHTDIFSDLQPGEEGVVSLIDALGTVHVNWDCGSGLGLVPGEDRWEVIG
jgi:hypothetical protein